MLYDQTAHTSNATGRGIDTHRAWEALSLGAVHIMMHSPLDALFENLPPRSTHLGRHGANVRESGPVAQRAVCFRTCSCCLLQVGARDGLPVAIPDQSGRRVSHQSRKQMRGRGDVGLGAHSFVCGML